MNNGEIIYTACALDTEGYIGIAKTTKQGHPKYFAFVRMEQTNYDWLESFKHLWGGSVSETRRRSLKHSRRWIWIVAGYRMIELLTAVKPHLRLKGVQAEICLELCSRMSTRKRKGGLTPKERALRENLYRECRALNRRGPSAKQAEMALIIQDQLELDESVLDGYSH